VPRKIVENERPPMPPRIGAGRVEEVDLLRVARELHERIDHLLKPPPRVTVWNALKEMFKGPASAPRA